ncbi:MAG: ABC transporter ATP-binding protein [Candidatus Methylacidiphilales bacterium]|nr:ABC transporter ATP-binding protein [Candidatus Methylacidiphilales bacterium]
MSAPLLTTQGLGKSFGGLKAIDAIDLQARPGSLLSVIGPNGAGKTTLFNCLTGIYRPDRGRVEFDGRNITGLAPHKACHLGIARTFQNIRLFPEMSALENILVGQFHHTTLAPWDILLRTPRFRRCRAAHLEEAHEWLALVGMEGQGETPARDLAYGMQRRLEIARALATRPRVLLLDEPCAGMNPSEVNGIIELISTLRRRDLAILLIEHHMKVVMEISDRVLVLDHGVMLAEGEPASIRANPDVIRAYLGGGNLI